MHKEDEQLEQALRRLTPRQPSALLRERIAQELEKPHVAPIEGARDPVAHGHVLLWLRIAAAVLIALGGCFVYVRSTRQGSDAPLQAQTRPPAPSPIAAEAFVEPVVRPVVRPQYHPVAVKRYVLGRDEGGVIREYRNGPARKVIYRTMERSDWHDPVRNRRCTIWKPHKQTVVMGMDVI